MAVGAFSPATVELVLARDMHCCVGCGRRVGGVRGVDWSVHHRMPRGSGGVGVKVRALFESPANALTLCGSGVSGCHGWVEANRDLARERGWLVSRHGVESPLTVPVVHGLFGTVWLLDDGSWKGVGE